MKKLQLAALATLLLGLLCLPLHTHGAGNDDNYITFLYNGFAASDKFDASTNPNGPLILNMDASITGGAVRLAPAGNQKKGSMFNRERVALPEDRSFSTYFTFQFSGGGGAAQGGRTGWADGFVFTVQTQSNSSVSIGGSLGYANIAPSIGIKFDTWENGEHGDTSNNSIAILKDGVLASPLVTHNVDKSTKDFTNGTYHVWIDYNGQTGEIEVRLNRDSSERPADPELAYTLPQKLTQILSSELVYVGFTASTGGAWQNHDIKTWYFTNQLDPIDIENKTYKQAPTGYTYTSSVQNDGSLDLTIVPIGGDDPAGLELSIDATDGAIVAPGTVTLNADGEAEVNLRSPDGKSMTTTITIQGPAGIRSQHEITIPGRTDAPDEDDIVANATDGIVTVVNVPNGANVTVYDHNDNMLDSETNVTDGEVQFTGLTLSTSNQIAVTFKVPAKGESDKTYVTPRVRSDVLDADDIVANGTKDTVAVSKVPSGAVVRVYDGPGGTLIGTGTNTDGEASDIVIALAPGVNPGDDVYVTIQESNKLESLPVQVEALAESAKPDAGQVETDGTADRVTVSNVPVGATVVIYDEDGNELDRFTNSTGTPADAEFEDLGLEIGDSILVTMIESGKLESEPLTVAVIFSESDAPDADDIDANATTSVVTVKNVPKDAKVTVYDKDGNELASNVNNDNGTADVSVTIPEAKQLNHNQEIDITITEPRKTESDKVRVTAKFEKSDAPDEDDIEANATTSVVTVKSVPKGATVTVYDENGDELASAVNNENGTADVNVTVPEADRLDENQEVDITITEPRKTESAKVRVAAFYEKSGKIDGNRITVNATDQTVTVTEVEPGAVITVYNEDGSDVLGTNQNNGAVKTDLVVNLNDPVTAGDTVLVTNTEQYHSESDSTAATALLETDPLAEENIHADATASRVTIKDVPDGAEVIIYDDQNEPIASVVNNKGETSDLTVDIDSPPLSHGQEIRVTIREPGMLESDPTVITARETTPAPTNPLDVDVDVEAGTVTVINVPPNTTVTLYDEDGNPIGSKTNGGPDPADVEFTDVELGSAIQITYTEPGKHESDKLIVDIEDASEQAVEDAISDLEVGYQPGDTWESVTLPVYVASVGKHNTAVSWTSSKPGVIEIPEPVGNVITTVVHRQAQDESVILTATVSKNGVAKTRTFLVIVKADGLVKQIEQDHRQVGVIGGADGEVYQPIDVDRIILTNGGYTAKIDKAVLDDAAVDQFVGPDSQDSTARIYVNEVAGDEADEYAVEVTESALAKLAGNGNSIEVRTDYGSILIDHATVEDMVDSMLDLYFRLVPVKDENQQRAINDGIRSDANVRNAASGKIVSILGQSLKVETNYSGYPTTLILYFEKNGIQVPSTNVAAFLNSLRVFIEHSTGAPPTEVVVPTPVYDNGNPVGVSITIDRFSTFSILQLRDVAPYIPVLHDEENGDATSGLDQIADGSTGSNGREIVLELDDDNYHVDPDGFTVTIGDQELEIEEVITDDRYVTIRLRDLPPPGYWIIVNYSPVAAGPEPQLLPFNGLMLANPGFHDAYILGFTDGTFRPDIAVSRAEMAAILARNLALPPKGEYEGLYQDVPASHWAWSDIERLRRIGLMIGGVDGRFRPQDTITRAEMAMIAAKWLGADPESAGSPAFSDVATSHWAAGAIDAASRAGILVGFTDGTFRPDEQLTRAQAVAVMNRLLGRRPHGGITEPSWPDVSPKHWAFREIEEASRSHAYLYDADGNETLPDNAE